MGKRLVSRGGMEGGCATFLCPWEPWSLKVLSPVGHVGHRQRPGLVKGRVTGTLL